MKNKAITYKQILEKKEQLPFYVYDYDMIEKQILKVKNNLPNNIELFYSAKANPNISILKIMNNFKLGLEVISIGELFAAKKAGFKMKEIILGGSAKSQEELSFAIKNNIGLFSIESISELENLNTLASQLNKKVKIIIRVDLINSQKKDNQKYTRVSGFGLSLDELLKILKSFSKEFTWLDFKGLHFYKMSRIIDLKILLAEVDNFFKAVKGIEKEIGIKVEIINIGGGFEVNIRQELNALAYLKGLNKLIQQYDFKNRKIILELGRYLVNNSGTYFTEVINVDKSKEKVFLTVKGIFNHLLKSLAAQPDRNHFVELKDNFKVEVLPKKKGKRNPSVICGQMSSSVDTFGRGFNCFFDLPKVNSGDFIAIKGVGAYGLTQALALFGSHLFPIEFLMLNNELKLIRKQGNYNDFLLNQCLVNFKKNESK